MITSDSINYGGEIDSLIAKGRQATDPAVREDAYEQAIHLIMEKAVIIPIYYKQYVVAKRTDTGGIDLSPISFMVRWEGLEHSKT